MSLKVPPLAPVLVRTVPSSSQMVHVCAELVLSSTMSWTSEAPHLIVKWTASLRSVAKTVLAHFHSVFSTKSRDWPLIGQSDVFFCSL